MTKETKDKKEKDLKLIEKMAEAGIHFGHTKSRKHPKMTPYIYHLRGELFIIDLQSTKKKLEEALNFIKTIVEKKGIILFVGLQAQAKEVTKKVAEECKMPYVVERWVGGTITNFENILRRIKNLKEMEEKRKMGEYEKYTKRERALIDKKIEKMNEIFGGLKNLDRKPDALFVLGFKDGYIAINEARKKNIPVIALIDTDGDPTMVDYPIPSNDDTVAALSFMLDQVKKAIIEVKNKK